MTDVVLVALIGVLGTLGGGVATPLVKDRIDRRARRRDETRREIGEILATVDGLLMRMLRLRHDAPDNAWFVTKDEVDGLLARLSYMLDKGEGEVVTVLSYASITASADGTRATNAANHWAVTAATSHVAAWYRGERSAAGMMRLVLDAWQMTFDGAVSGLHQINGSAVDPSEMDDVELARRAEIEAQGGLIAMTNKENRRPRLPWHRNRRNRL